MVACAQTKTKQEQIVYETIFILECRPHSIVLFGLVAAFDLNVSMQISKNPDYVMIMSLKKNLAPRAIWCCTTFSLYGN